MLGTAFGGHNSSKYSPSFFDLIKSIGESTSKQEQDRIIIAERNRLKSELRTGQRGGSSAVLGAVSGSCNASKSCKEWVIRALYCEMLGTDASFAFIQGINLAQDNQNLIAKRTGYLFCGLSFVPKSDANLLLVNTLLKDLDSSNWLFNVAALVAISALPSPEITSQVIPQVVNLTAHSEGPVRKRAYLALQTIMRVTPESLPPILDIVSQALSDSDAIVMSASLPLIELLVNDPDCISWSWNSEETHDTLDTGDSMDQMTTQRTSSQGVLNMLDDDVDDEDVLCANDNIEETNQSYPHLVDTQSAVSQTNPCLGTDLIDFFVALLEKVAILKELPRCHDYYDCPAPWIQVRIINILTNLGLKFPNKVEPIRNILVRVLDLMATQGSSKNIVAALLFGVARSLCVLQEYSCVKKVNDVVYRFVNSQSSNLRYAGLMLLTQLAILDPSIAKEYSIKIVEFLDDEDEQIQRAALKLVAEVTTSTNIGFVLGRLIGTIQLTYDRSYRKQLCDTAWQLLASYAPDGQTFISKAIELIMSVGGDSVGMESTCSLIIDFVDIHRQHNAQVAEFAVQSFSELFINFSNDWLENGTPVNQPMVQICVIIIAQFGSDNSALRSRIVEFLKAQGASLDDETLSMVTYAISALGEKSAPFNIAKHRQQVVEKSLHSVFEKLDNSQPGPAYRPEKSSRPYAEWEQRTRLQDVADELVSRRPATPQMIPLVQPAVYSSDQQSPSRVHHTNPNPSHHEDAGTTLKTTAGGRWGHDATAATSAPSLQNITKAAPVGPVQLSQTQLARREEDRMKQEALARQRKKEQDEKEATAKAIFG